MENEKLIKMINDADIDISIDFEREITNEQAEEYKDAYKEEIKVLKCLDCMTLKEFAYCRIHGIDECTLVKKKYRGDKCNDCEDLMWVSMLSTDYTSIIIAIILVLIMVFVVK